MGIVTSVLRLGRECRYRQLLPRPAAVAAPQLGPEMAEIERGIHGAASVRQHRRNRIAEKPNLDTGPRTVMPRAFKQTLVGSNMQPLRHPLLHQPPVHTANTRTPPSGPS